MRCVRKQSAFLIEIKVLNLGHPKGGKALKLPSQKPFQCRILLIPMEAGSLVVGGVDVTIQEPYDAQLVDASAHGNGLQRGIRHWLLSAAHPEDVSVGKLLGIAVGGERFHAHDRNVRPVGCMAVLAHAKEFAIVGNETAGTASILVVCADGRRRVAAKRAFLEILGYVELQRVFPVDAKRGEEVVESVLVPNMAVTEAVADIQNKFGNITKLDEKALEDLAVVMGGKISEMATMGLG